MPTDWKPMATVGAGVAEIRIRGRLEHRIIYIAKFEEAVYVLHAFRKVSQRTSAADLDLARARLKEVEAQRRSRKEK
jgi:phage-related protein